MSPVLGEGGNRPRRKPRPSGEAPPPDSARRRRSHCTCFFFFPLEVLLFQDPRSFCKKDYSRTYLPNGLIILSRESGCREAGGLPSPAENPSCSIPPGSAPWTPPNAAPELVAGPAPKPPARPAREPASLDPASAQLGPGAAATHAGRSVHFRLHVQRSPGLVDSASQTSGTVPVVTSHPGLGRLDGGQGLTISALACAPASKLCTLVGVCCKCASDDPATFP